jgi:metal-sulfur cluster biosynthetic enzyme
MENIIQEKIDRVLDRIKDPQSGMTLLQLGLVKKIRYVEKRRKLIVFFNRLGHCKACCAALNMVMLADFENAINEGLKAEFPQFSVAFTDSPNI